MSYIRLAKAVGLAPLTIFPLAYAVQVVGLSIDDFADGWRVFEIDGLAFGGTVVVVLIAYFVTATYGVLVHYFLQKCGKTSTIFYVVLAIPITAPIAQFIAIRSPFGSFREIVGYALFFWPPAIIVSLTFAIIVRRDRACESDVSAE
jgi:hypothetical protein